MGRHVQRALGRAFHRQPGSDQSHRYPLRALRLVVDDGGDRRLVVLREEARRFQAHQQRLGADHFADSRAHLGGTRVSPAGRPPGGERVRQPHADHGAAARPGVDHRQPGRRVRKLLPHFPGLLVLGVAGQVDLREAEVRLHLIGPEFVERLERVVARLVHQPQARLRVRGTAARIQSADRVDRCLSRPVRFLVRGHPDGELLVTRRDSQQEFFARVGLPMDGGDRDVDVRPVRREQRQRDHGRALPQLDDLRVVQLVAFDRQQRCRARMGGIEDQARRVARHVRLPVGDHLEIRVAVAGRAEVARSGPDPGVARDGLAALILRGGRHLEGPGQLAARQGPARHAARIRAHIPLAPRGPQVDREVGAGLALVVDRADVQADRRVGRQHPILRLDEEPQRAARDLHGALLAHAAPARVRHFDAHGIAVVLGVAGRHPGGEAHLRAARVIGRQRAADDFLAVLLALPFVAFPGRGIIAGEIVFVGGRPCIVRVARHAAAHLRAPHRPAPEVGGRDIHDRFLTAHQPRALRLHVDPVLRLPVLGHVEVERVRLAGDLGADVISADGRLGGEPEPAVERAEVAGRRASAAEQRVGRVVDLDLYRQGRRHLVAGAPLPPDDPLEVDHLPRTVDRAVRVEVGAVIAALLAIDSVEAGEGD